MLAALGFRLKPESAMAQSNPRLRSLRCWRAELFNKPEVISKLQKRRGPLSAGLLLSSVPLDRLYMIETNHLISSDSDRSAIRRSFAASIAQQAEHRCPRVGVSFSSKLTSGQEIHSGDECHSLAPICRLNITKLLSRYDQRGSQLSLRVRQRQVALQCGIERGSYFPSGRIDFRLRTGCFFFCLPDSQSSSSPTVANAQRSDL